MKRENGPSKKPIDKAGPAKSAKKKLEFKQNLPLYGKTIYLDVKDARQRKKLDDSLTVLGAQVEKFLSKEINYVISSNTNTTLPNKCTDGIKDRPESPSFVSTPSPFNCGQGGGSPTSINNAKQKTQTRAQAMVKLAQSQAKTTPVLLNAEKFGIKVIPVDAAQKWVEKESSKLQTISAPKPQVIKKKPVFKVKKLQAPLLKFEANNLHYRPIQLEFDSWPHCNVDTPAGSCPYDGITVGRAQKTEAEYRDKVVASPNGKELQDSVETPRENKTQSKGGQNEGSTSKLIGMQILTAGDLKRRQEKKRNVEKKRGYCECCMIKYDNVEKHLRDEDHRKYARDKSNFRQLDIIIKTVNSPAKFLKKVLHNQCLITKSQKATSADNNTNFKDKLLTRTYKKSSPIKRNSPRKCVANLKESFKVEKIPDLDRKPNVTNQTQNNHVKTDTNNSADVKTPKVNMKSLPPLISSVDLDQSCDAGPKLKAAIPQKKLIIRNMAIGSLQVASTSPDKILRNKEAETIAKKGNVEDSESGISKSVYFSSDYSNSSVVSDSNPSSDVTTASTLKSVDISRFHKKNSSQLGNSDSQRKKDSSLKSDLNCKRKSPKLKSPKVGEIRQLRSGNKDQSATYYTNKVKSAKKQLNKIKTDKPKLKHKLKIKSKVRNSVDTLQTCSQPTAKSQPQFLLDKNKLSASSPIVKNASAPIPMIPIAMNNKCLSFSNQGGRKSRNSMEVQFHDYMIFNSLTDIWGKKKKKSKGHLSELIETEAKNPDKNKTDILGNVDAMATDSELKVDSEPIFASRLRSKSLNNLTPVKNLEVKNSVEVMPGTGTELQSGSKFQKKSLSGVSVSSHLNTSQKSVEKSQQNSNITDTNSSQVVRKIKHHRQQPTILESENTGSASSTSKISGVVPFSQTKSRRSKVEKDRQCTDSKLLQNVIVAIKPLDSSAFSSQSNTHKVHSDSLHVCSPQKDMDYNNSQSPIFKKSPAFRNLHDVENTEDKNQSVESCSPRSGVSITPRRRVKRQRKISSSIKKHIVVSDTKGNSHSLHDYNKSRRSLHKELLQISASKDTVSVDTKSVINTVSKTKQPQHIRYDNDGEEIMKRSDILDVTNNSCIDNCAFQMEVADVPSSGTKCVKLNHSWKVLSDRSVSKLLQSEPDSTPFLGFLEKDTESIPLSGLSYEEQSEINLDDSYDWVINSSASDFSDFENLVPTTFSSPNKASNSSWLDACEEYVMTSVTKNLLSNCASTPIEKVKSYKSKLKLHKKNHKQNQNIGNVLTLPAVKTAKTETTPKKLRKRKRHNSSDVLHTIKEHDVSDNSISTQPRLLRKQQLISYEESIDEDIIFNFNSPQKNKKEFSPLKEENFTSPEPANKYKLLKGNGRSKAKFEMKYFTKACRKSPQNTSKRQLQSLHKFNDPHVNLIIVTPPKNRVIKR